MASVTGFDNDSYVYNGKYLILNNSGYEITICYAVNKTFGDSPWQSQDPLSTHLPSLGVQVGLMVFTTRLLMFILKPLHQPRFIAQLIAGILVGPTCMGRFTWSEDIVPFESNMILETLAGMGLTYYMFLVGLETDLSIIGYLGKKSLSIAIAGILYPIVAAAGLYQVPKFIWYKHKQSYEMPVTWGFMFWSLTLSVTSFPDLARILSDVKLLHTDIGRTALSTAVISDITVWVLLAFAITIVDKTRVIFMTLLPTVAFLLICWFFLRPGVAWMIKQTKRKGRNFSEMHINFILTGVAVCGMITDACGAHSMIGGFMLGVIIPNGEIAMKMMEKIEEFVTGILLPVFFMVTGLRTNLHDLVANTRHGGEMLILIAIGATSAKLLSTVLVSLAFRMSPSDGLALGNLLNTKGVLAIIVLNEGRNLKLLDGTTMSLMVFTILFMTALVGPIFSIVNKTTKRAAKYKQRTIQRSNQETEHRILACVHSIRNISGIINILKVSNATKKSPFCVFVVHLVELTGHASAMLIVHDTYRTNITTNSSPEKAESEQIIRALLKYESTNEAVSVHPLTAVSPYSSMHEDICHLAEDKQVAMILVPFHKEPNADGSLQGDNLSIKKVNQHLLDMAPCSVGILVDRGLGSSISKTKTSSNISIYGKSGLRLAVIFIGGVDDQEALSYGWKMAGTTNGISLTVVRFLPGKDVILHDVTVGDDNKDDDFASSIDGDNEEEFDDEYVNEFRFKTMNYSSISYHEKLVNSSNEVVESIKTMYSDYDFYIVGRGRGVRSPLTIGLSEWCEYPELGPIGDLLVSSDLTVHASVLVTQSVAVNLRSGSLRHKEKFGNQKWASPILNPYYKASVKRHKKENVD